MVLTPSFQKLKRGDKAPDFSLKGVDDKIYALADFADKEGLLVIFMCNHCPYVKAKIGAIVDLHKKWGQSQLLDSDGRFSPESPRGVKNRPGNIAFVGINSNDPEYEGEGMELMKEFAKERNMSFPYLSDETQEIAKAYGATCTPDPFLFDKDQKLAFHGRIDDALEPGDEAKENTMDENIQKLLSGGDISDELKSSMGCSIKWIQS